MTAIQYMRANYCNQREFLCAPHLGYVTRENFENYTEKACQNIYSVFYEEHLMPTSQCL